MSVQQRLHMLRKHLRAVLQDGVSSLGRILVRHLSEGVFTPSHVAGRHPPRGSGAPTAGPSVSSALRRGRVAGRGTCPASSVRALFAGKCVSHRLSPRSIQMLHGREDAPKRCVATSLCPWQPFVTQDTIPRQGTLPQPFMAYVPVLLPSVQLSLYVVRGHEGAAVVRAVLGFMAAEKPRIRSLFLRAALPGPVVVEQVDRHARHGSSVLDQLVTLVGPLPPHFVVEEVTAAPVCLLRLNPQPNAMGAVVDPHLPVGAVHALRGLVELDHLDTTVEEVTEMAHIHVGETLLVGGGRVSISALQPTEGVAGHPQQHAAQGRSVAWERSGRSGGVERHHLAKLTRRH